ncbi:PAAR domain-containing protein [Burkholderia ubonensis]|uniref:PAAR domain-containing protein n=1 Tax=Burkholderia ubonensis TaxID=101571 RepID=UPI00358F4E81
MNYGFARVGDETDHGGRILTGNATFDIDGKKLAQVNLTVCSKCNRVFPITTGTSNFVVDEKEAANHVSKTACGATTIGRTSFGRAGGPLRRDVGTSGPTSGGMAYHRMNFASSHPCV